MRHVLHRLVVLSGLALLLAACASGPVRRVSEPSAQIQQLTVRADGRWDVALRLDNFSSIPMRFDRVALALTIAGESAGDVGAAPAVGIGPEAADVVNLVLQPSAGAKLAVADALATRRDVPYVLTGEIVATPDEGRARTFRIDRRNSLSPAPGLPGVLR
ncbi:LEA/WHy family protein [Lysobacter humi (ex Lee et al. 2017)]